MRHHAIDQMPRLAPEAQMKWPSTLDRAVGYWETAMKLYGLARGAYTVGRAAAPYVAALL